LPDVYVPTRIPLGLAGITFGEGTVAGICADVPAYNPIVGIYRRTGVMKRRYVEPVKAPQL
jgi:hypothetical protein